ncbi:MAG: hemolysin III family protein [Archangium sp.]|nr:hemolysin III family protein [Archangium sp.]
MVHVAHGEEVYPKCYAARVNDKPTLRGVLHQWSAGIALGAGLVLVAMAPTVRSSLGAGVFAASLVTLLTVSATYHRVNWSPPARAWMRRADHASIFILIAGTYTPVALLSLPEAVGSQLLLQIWGAATAGVVVSLFWAHAPKVITAALALLVGWLLVPYFSAVRQGLGELGFVLVLAGGVAYSLGAVAYAAKRPNPRPGVFGYHEVFHALTVVGAALHFAAVIGLVRAAR